MNLRIIENISLKWARYLFKHSEAKNTSVQLLHFSMQLWISILLIFSLTGIGALLLKTFSISLLALVYFGFLRYFSGGFHMKSLEACVVVTVTLALLIPQLHISNQLILLVLNLVALGIVAYFAPTGEGQKIKTNRQKVSFKCISLFIIGINFFIFHPALILFAFIQSLTLMKFPFHLRGGEDTI